MKTGYATASSFVLLVLGCSAAEDPTSPYAPAPAPPPEETRPEIDFSPLEATIEAERVALGAPGAAVIVAHRGKIVLAKGFGTRPDSEAPIQTTTLFRVSSMAKTWTALTAMRLIEKGELSLDTKVVDRVPGFTVAGSPPETAALTLRHLLTHRSGLYDGVASDASAAPADDGMLGRWIASPVFQSTFYFMTPPDRTYNYTNVGYAVAGHMIERASGKPLRTIVRESVLAPLGMSRVLCTPEEILADGDYTNGKGEVRVIDPTVDWSPINYAHGGGSACHASADDVMKVARFLLQGDARVVADATLRAMKTPSGDSDQPWVADLYHRLDYGIGLQVSDGLLVDGTYHPLEIIGHEGSGRGYAGIMQIVPAQELAFVALGNANDAYFDKSFVHAVKLAGLPDGARTPQRGVDSTEYARFVGTYHEPRVLKDVVIRQVDGKLFADISGLSISGRELTPDHGRGFELLDVRTENGYYDHFVHFVPDASGESIELIRNRYWVAKRVP
ncbi:MAG: serine hydrolase [Labilithrix sp.]|nr:serine hydrolase [Labilithrix sp.]